MANSHFNISRLQTLWMRLMDSRLGTFLSACACIQLGLMAYIGSLVWLEKIGAAANVINPIAWVTLASVALVELSILTKMTKDGVRKSRGIAPIQDRFVITKKGKNGEADKHTIVSFDAVKRAYYLNVIEWENLESNAAVQRIFPKHYQTAMQRHQAIQAVIKNVVDGMLKVQGGSADLDNLLKDRLIAATPLQKKVFRLHVLRALHTAAHESEKVYNDAWVHDEITSLERELIVAQYEKTNGDTPAYVWRLRLLRGLTVVAGIAASVIWGWMGGIEFSGSLVPLLGKVGFLSVPMLTACAIPFAVLMGLAYFFQFYQTINLMIMSGMWSRWWQSCKNLMVHLWQSKSEQRPIMYAATKSIAFVVYALLTLGVFSLAILSMVCGIFTFRRVFDFNQAVQWVEVVSLMMAESCFAVYTARSSWMVNDLFASMSGAALSLKQPFMAWWAKRWEPFQVSQAPTMRAKLFRFVVFSIALVLTAANDLIVMSFAAVIFVVHAVMLGFVGDNNPLFAPWVSDMFTAIMEAWGDLSLYNQPHDHGPFDVLVRGIYAVVTALPALMVTLCLRAAPKPDELKYFTLWDGTVVSERDFLYRWGRYWVEHIKEASPPGAKVEKSLSVQHDHAGCHRDHLDAPTKAKSLTWFSAVEGLATAAMVFLGVYVVASLLFPPLHLVSVGGLLLQALMPMAQLSAPALLWLNMGVLALAATAYSLAFGQLGVLFVRHCTKAGRAAQEAIRENKVAHLIALQGQVGEENQAAVHEIKDMLASLGHEEGDAPPTPVKWSRDQFTEAMEQKRWTEGRSKTTRTAQWNGLRLFDVKVDESTALTPAVILAPACAGVNSSGDI